MQNKIDSNEKQIFDYCKSCYNPIYENEKYVNINNKHYCLTCGFQQLAINYVHIAEVKRND